MHAQVAHDLFDRTGVGDLFQSFFLDDGVGIAPDKLQKVFEPFFSTKTERGGTGLGLAITRDMIAQLGGEVGLENLEGGGARATIRLQRWQEPEPSS